MKKLFICSPYRGETSREQKANIETAKNLCMLFAHKGYAVFAPHLLYTQFLQDDEEADRVTGINSGIEFLKCCDAIYVYNANGISAGMQLEIEAAEKLNKEIIYFTDTLEEHNGLS